MDKLVTALYHKITPVHHGVSFEQSLKDLYDQGSVPSSREHAIDAAVMRLERLETSNAFVRGEMVRKQTENIPPEVSDAGLSKLSVAAGGGLGHCVAFCYNTDTGILGLEANRRAVGISKFLLYVQLMTDRPYMHDPVLSAEAWDQYFRGDTEVRKFEVKLAPSDVLPSDDGGAGSGVFDVAQELHRLSEAMSAPLVTLTLGMGHQKGSLKSVRIVNTIKRLLSVGDDGKLDVKKLNTSIRVDGETQVIDLLENLLRDRKELDLNEDPDINYSRREIWLQDCMQRHNGYFMRVYNAGRSDGN